MLQPSNGSVRAPWTANSLRDWVHNRFAVQEVLVLANREPFTHDFATDGRVTVHHSTSGLISALEPLVRATSGVWVAHGSGTADRVVVDGRDRLDVTSSGSVYRLRRVWLDDEELRGYYEGFSNEGLWPLCHRAYVRPIFRADDFNTYWRVNRRFVDALCDEARSRSPLVLVQDYHFALAPLMLHERLPESAIAVFWHIPWPTWHSFEVCPMGRHLLEGMLGANLIGFQTPVDCRHFLDTVEHSLEAHIDREDYAITYAGRRTVVRAYPASIEWPDRHVLESPPVETCREQIFGRLGLPPQSRLAVGVTRLDYTKGIEEAFGAVERMLQCYPEYRDTFTFVQLAATSRERLPAYRELAERVRLAADRVNRRFGHNSWLPVVLLDAHHEPADVYAFLRAADICYVSSLHDGMNLVAKEFVAARDDELGVLVLSAFAGAARELRDALVVNPYDLDGAAHALVAALAMSRDEQRRRMSAMRAIVAEHNAYKWAARMLADMSRVRVPLPVDVRWPVATSGATTDFTAMI
ncbi:MAG: trehalose-6-phosphate synthase [Vicinamibacterales bacterium]